jgi:4-amino-4-deoxy-L-arabinose transferase-like glycosyltransferase
MMALAGLLLGAAFQVKQVALFDMLAFLLGFFLLTTPAPGLLGKHLRRSWPGLAVLGAAAAVPTLAVILVYVVSGHWDAWVAGNMTAHRAFYGRGGPEVAWEAGLHVMIEQAPLWIGGLLAVLFAGRLTRDSIERRAVLFLMVWVVLIGLGQVFLRYMADHYFLQFLPPLCLLAGFALVRAVLCHVDRPVARRVLLTALVCLTVFAVARNPIVNALYIARDRYIWGEAWAGDAARQVAANLQPDLRPEDAVFVVGFMPIVYYLTVARIPTRFAFTGLPNRLYPGRDGCPWVAPKLEMQRILTTKPRFIVVEQGVFFEELPPDIKGLLVDQLERHYRLRARFPRHPIHLAYPFERFVMNGATAAEVHEWADTPSALVPGSAAK